MEDEQYFFWLGADAEGFGGHVSSSDDREEEFLRNQHEDEYRSAK